MAAMARKAVMIMDEKELIGLDGISEETLKNFDGNKGEE